MSTNYYARIKPKKDDKDKLIKAIIDDDYETVDRLHSQMYVGEVGYYDYDKTNNGLCGVVHLGKRIDGRPFVWDANFDYDKSPKFYDLTKTAIKEFVHRDDVIVYDEYSETLDKDKFLDMAFSWGK